LANQKISFLANQNEAPQTQKKSQDKCPFFDWDLYGHFQIFKKKFFLTDP